MKRAFATLLLLAGTGLSAEPPAWLHDGAWNMLRLSARGAGNPASRFLVQTVPEGFSFIFR